MSFCMFLIAFYGFSQTMLDKEVGDFQEIKVYDLIEVNVVFKKTCNTNKYENNYIALPRAYFS